MLSIEICDDQNLLPVNEDHLRRAAEAVLVEANFHMGVLSIAVVDDQTIHALNRQFLQHDYPTDVLSFVLEQDDGRIEGEVIVSAETAARSARQYGWSADAELLLYVIHGTLHLVGHDDQDDAAREVMREAERRHLARFDLKPRELPPDGNN
jgi:probable rRNA maturation factor